MIETLLGLGIGALILTSIVWLLPFVLVIRSDKTTGMEKLVWVLLMFFFSWFLWVIYAIVAPLAPKEPS